MRQLLEHLGRKTICKCGEAHHHVREAWQSVLIQHTSPTRILIFHAARAYGTCRTGAAYLADSCFLSLLGANRARPRHGHVSASAGPVLVTPP